MKFNLSDRVRKQLIESSLTNCTRWAEHKIHMPHPFAGKMSFDRFPWQKEILNIEEGIVTVKKAAQIGFSVAGLVRALYVVGESVNDVLYVLPTQGLAGDFSKGRLDALVDLSPHLKDLFIKTNSVGLKVTKQRANLYIRGSVSSRGLVSVPVSSAIIDEYDRCADNTYDLVTERLSGQLSKYLFSLSTPTLPEFGIDKQFKNGTMEEFFFPCPSCNKHITLRWPDNVVITGEYPGDPDTERSYYKCNECGMELPHADKMDWLSEAAWVPARNNVQGHRSFHINQMFSTTVTPQEMVNAFHKSQMSDLAAIEFQNQKMGEPHISEGARLTDAIVAENYDRTYKIGDERPDDSSRMICMGIDVGTFLDCWIAEFTYERDPGNMPYENSRMRLLQAIRVPQDDWNQLPNLMREWQVRHACIDFQPDTVNARRFCRSFKGFSSMVAYRRGTVGNEIKETTDEQGVPCLTVDRTSFLDMVLGRFHKNKVTIPSNTQGIVREHLKAPIRTYEMDEMGMPRGVYKSIADDHFAHAAAYCEIAHFRAYCQSTGRSIKPGESL
ncbi:MAG: hypothetical protein GY906_11345 [bacterium]|nr:hypothetical protein [bacterium]